MKTNNIASYSDVLVTCMRQNPKWILLSEVRSAEAVMAVRNSVSSGHYILSTIHADKAASIPSRMYSLLETNQDIDQFLKSIHRYVQLGIYVRGYQDKVTKKFHREIAEVTEFYVTKDNEAGSNTIYRKTQDGNVIRNNPSDYLIDYLETQGVLIPKNIVEKGEVRVASAINPEPVTQPTQQPVTAQTVQMQQQVVRPTVAQPQMAAQGGQVVRPVMPGQVQQQGVVGQPVRPQNDNTNIGNV